MGHWKRLVIFSCPGGWGIGGDSSATLKSAVHPVKATKHFCVRDC